MAKRSLVLTSTSAKGSRMSKAITDINPTAAGDVLLTFAQKLNNLTTNTYVKTDCVDKFNLDTEAGAIDSRPVPTITGNVYATPFDNETKIAINVDTNSDGTCWAAVKADSALRIYPVLIGTNDPEDGLHRFTWMVYGSKTASEKKPFTLICNIEGSETYKPVSLEIHFDENGKVIENG